MNIVVTSFGSIGRRHVMNLITRGIKPFVVTHYPDRAFDAVFIEDLAGLPASASVTHAIVCSPTARHVGDFCRLADLGVRHVLLEKPIAGTLEDAARITETAGPKGIEVYTAYNMRYLPCFWQIRQFVRDHLHSMRIVEISMGHYLPEWRPYKDYRLSYSTRRSEGGGVDLDLSHEIDYMVWLFGLPAARQICRKKISTLELDAPDFFAGFFDYGSFVALVELDYIKRKRERSVRILCENGNTLLCDFAGEKMSVWLHEEGREITDFDESCFDMNRTYVDELDDFLNNRLSDRGLLPTGEEAFDVLKLII